MQVQAGMSTLVLTVGPDHTLAQVATAMTDRNVGAAVVNDPEQPGPGIITERDILRVLGSGGDPSTERVSAHLSTEITFAEPGWSLEYAAEAMVRGGFRHLIVIDGGELVGVLSMRDIVRCWVQEGAVSEMPAAS